ncbi:MAG TPA: O-antigen ligase family protein, partial [Anaerolineae bacterium]|nr:O-antigen ligase family protein [Anaerolineae bacterium]
IDIEMQTQNTSTLKQILPQVKEKSAAPFYKDILLGLLLLAAPFLLFPNGYGLLALLALPTIWLIRWALTGRIAPRTALDWPILLILLMVLASMGATFDLSFSIGKIAGVLLGIVIFYAIVDLAESRSSLQTVITFFILVGIGLAIVSALGVQWRYRIPLIRPLVDQVPKLLQDVRGAESGFNPNQVGGVLIFFVPLQLVLLGYWLKRKISQPHAGGGKVTSVFGVIFIGVSLLITFGVLLFSQSRGALGGTVAGLVVIAAISTRWGKVLAVIGLIVLGLVIYLGAGEGLVTSGLETEVVETVGLDGRLEVWSRALQGLADFPLGMGMNNFRRVMPILYPGFIVAPTKDIAHAHNHLLQVGLDLGIPGLIAYLALWLVAGFLLYQVLTGSGTQFYQAIALGLVGSFTAYFIYGLTDAVALGAKPGFVFWWALGLVMATYNLFYKDKSVS